MIFKRNWKTWVITQCRLRAVVVCWLGLCFAQTISFYRNGLNLVAGGFFATFQQDSESLVIGKIVLDRNYPRNEERAKLGFSTSDAFAYDSKHIVEGYDLLKRGSVETKFSPYLSQFGLQGALYSSLYNHLGLNRLQYLNWLCSFLTSISLLLLTWGYSKSVGKGFALAFLLSVSLSPWVTSFARNLYWSPVLWFLPAVFSMFAYLHRDRPVRYTFLFLVYLAVFLKSLCGYEYISTIIWLACAVFLIDPFLEKPRLARGASLKYATIVLGLGVGGFLCALLLHSSMRGNTMFEGLAIIWEQDVRRRTYGSPDAFGAAFAASLASTPMAVLNTYISLWSTELLYRIPGSSFVLLIATALITLGYKFWSKHISRWRDFGMFVIFALGPVSWFCLAKAHSFNHTHINYVLWYFGFVAALIYISASGALLLSIKLSKFLSAAK